MSVTELYKIDQKLFDLEKTLKVQVNSVAPPYIYAEDFEILDNLVGGLVKCYDSDGVISICEITEHNNNSIKVNNCPIGYITTIYIIANLDYYFDQATKKAQTDGAPDEAINYKVLEMLYQANGVPNNWANMYAGLLSDTGENTAQLTTFTKGGLL